MSQLLASAGLIRRKPNKQEIAAAAAAPAQVFSPSVQSSGSQGSNAQSATALAALAAERKKIEDAAALAKKKTENEGVIRNRISAMEAQRKQQTVESITEQEQQRERDQMVKTSSTRRKGRKSLRINIENGSSSYEGSSGINITI